MSALCYDLGDGMSVLMTEPPTPEEAEALRTVLTAARKQADDEWNALSDEEKAARVARQHEADERIRDLHRRAGL